MTLKWVKNWYWNLKILWRFSNMFFEVYVYVSWLCTEHVNNAFWVDMQHFPKHTISCNIFSILYFGVVQHSAPSSVQNIFVQCCELTTLRSVYCFCMLWLPRLPCSCHGNQVMEALCHVLLLRSYPVVVPGWSFPHNEICIIYLQSREMQSRGIER